MNFEFLQKMSYRELLDLNVRVKKAIGEKKIAEKMTVKNKVQKLIKDSGFDMGEIVGNASTKSLKGRKVAPKFRNPKSPEETWSGRGRQPKWLVAELKKGRPLKSFLIK